MLAVTVAVFCKVLGWGADETCGGDDRICFASTAVAEVPLNATNCGERLTTNIDAKENDATIAITGLETVIAPGRFTSKICEMRRAVCFIRVTAAWAKLSPRRTKLFSARDTRQRA